MFLLLISGEKNFSEISPNFFRFLQELVHFSKNLRQDERNLHISENFWKILDVIQKFSYMKVLKNSEDSLSVIFGENFWEYSEKYSEKFLRSLFTRETLFEILSLIYEAKVHRNIYKDSYVRNCFKSLSPLAEVLDVVIK